MSSISTFLDQRRLADLASDPDYVPRPGSGTGPREFCAEPTAEQVIAYTAYAAVRAAHPATQALRRHNDLATARIPCVSDADPCPDDSEQTTKEYAAEQFGLAVAAGDFRAELPTTIGRKRIATLLTWIDTDTAELLLKACSTACNPVQDLTLLERQVQTMRLLKQFVDAAGAAYAADNVAAYE